jgi:ribosomal protein S27AE
MIIHYDYNSKTYRENFQNCNPTDEMLRTWQLVCPSCGAKNTMAYHAFYWRHLISPSMAQSTESGILFTTLDEQRMRIIRVKCSSCGHTHAVLPCDVVPYRLYSVDSIMALLALYFSYGWPPAKIAETFGLSIRVIYRLIHLWQLFVIRLAMLLRIVFALYPASENAFDNSFVFPFAHGHKADVTLAFQKHFDWCLFMTHALNPVPKRKRIGLTINSKS